MNEKKALVAAILHIPRNDYDAVAEVCHSTCLCVITLQGWNCRGVGGLNPPFHVYRHSFLSENRPQTSISWQNFTHFGS